MASAKPSPPSAMGARMHSAEGSACLRPLAMACAATEAEMEPLNLSGAMRMRMANLLPAPGMRGEAGDPFSLALHLPDAQSRFCKGLSHLGLLVAHDAGENERAAGSERAGELRGDLDEDGGI